MTNKVFNYFKAFTFRRVLFLLGGVAIIVQSILDHTYILALFGSWFVYQSLMNIGCCGSTCNVYSQKKQ